MDQDGENLLQDAAQRASVSIIVTDARLDDNPITFVNEAFEKITLYSKDDAIGRNCRFLQGEQTEPDRVEAIRRHLREGGEFEVTLTNHRADGAPFRNQLLVAPVQGGNGDVYAYFGVMRELASGAEPTHTDAEALDLLRELQHRVKNHLAMVVSMIRLHAKRPVTKDSLHSVGRRVEALALLYEELFASSTANLSRDVVHAGAYLTRIANVIAGLDGRSDIQINVECDEIDLPVDRAARLGLLLSELLTNALEHAFDGRDSGVVNVRFQRLSTGKVRLTVEDDGIGLPEDSNWPYEALSVEGQKDRARHETGKLDTTGHDGHSGVGGTIVVSLTQTLAATLDVNRALEGTTVTVDMDSDPPDPV